MKSKLLLAASSTATQALSGEVGGVGTWPIIGWIAVLFGFLMRGIFLLFGSMNIYSVTLCIIVFTIVTKMLVLPLTIKQQKFSKVQAIMQPEIQALQKKYEGRRDQASMAKMQAEQQQIYEKYGASMSAGCLPSLIQLPIIFAFYPVILYFSYYVPELKELSTAAQEAFFKIGSIDLLDTPANAFTTGGIASFAWVIPILAAGLQFLSVKLTNSMSKAPDGSENPAASSMKMMTYTMPIMSLIFCFTLSGFIGVYWVVQSAVTVVQQIFINKHFEKISIEDLIKENVEKMNKKRAKKGLAPVSERDALKSLKDVQSGKVSTQKTEEQLAKRDEKVKESTEYYKGKSTAAPGSLAEKAGMVKAYNERNKKK